MAATAPLVNAEVLEKGDEKEPVASLSFAGRLLSSLTCQRRAPAAKADTSATAAAYEALRKKGQELSVVEKAAFKQMAWWSAAETKTGAKVFILAPRGPGGDTECSIDMWKLFAYAVDQMHEHVVKHEQRFAVVWVQFSAHRVWPFSALTLKNHHLHEKYGRFLDAVHVVHPSWTVRLLRLALWPIASDEFWDIFQCHERVEFLDTYMSLKKLALPDDIAVFDKWLDTQAEEITKNAAKQMDGRWGSQWVKNDGFEAMTSPDSEKFKEQMENIQGLMRQEQQGRDKKDD